MVINKTYDIKQLAEVLQQKVEESKKYKGAVKLDILTAHDILEVLQETHKREQRNQTLESALTFIEKEDGTHTNLMEEKQKSTEHSKPKKKTKKRFCFGEYKRTNPECLTCGCGDMCLIETETKLIDPEEVNHE